MDDVALAAGVSRTSVSRVFLGQKKVSEQTILRVREVAAQLGYVPNRIASGLASGTTRTVGLLLADPACPRDALLLAHLHDEARRSGFELIAMATSGGAPEDRPASLSSIIGMQVQGLIIVGGAIPDAELQPFATRLPILRTGVPQAGVATHAIWCDAADAGRQVAGHVAHQGHRQVVVLRCPKRHAESLRAGGMLEVLAEAGVEAEVLELDRPEATIGQALDLAEAGRATAILCPSDEIALDVLRSARGRNLSVPGQVSVTGVDGLTVGLDLIGLTTVRLDVAELARRTIASLVRILSDGSGERDHQLVPGVLVPGHTVARIAAA